VKVRLKTDPSDIGCIWCLNTSALTEVIVHFKGNGCSSYFYSSLDVQLPDGTWKDLCEALKDKDVITDNYNTQFHFPGNEEDRKRGYIL
jgi:hypothetical protein